MMVKFFDSSKEWNFVDGNAMDIPLEDFPLYQYIDYVRVWREVETPGKF